MAYGYPTYSDVQLWNLIVDIHAMENVREKAYWTLYQRHYERLCISLRSGKKLEERNYKSIEDAYNDLFLYIWREKDDKYAGKKLTNVRAWLRIVGMRRWFDKLELGKEKKTFLDLFKRVENLEGQESLQVELLLSEFDHEKTAEQSEKERETEEKELIDMILAILPKPYHEIFIRKYKGEKTGQIAKDLGLSPIATTNKVYEIKKIVKKNDDVKNLREKYKPPRKEDLPIWVIIFLIPTLLWSNDLFAQRKAVGKNTGEIKGQVTDRQNYPLANIRITICGNDSNAIGGYTTKTNTKGYYRLKNIPVGKVNLRCSGIGYKSQYTEDIQLNTGQTRTQVFRLKENTHSRSEGNDSSWITAPEPENTYSLVSVHSYSAEQVKRFTNVVGDPTRFATYYSGVRPFNNYRNGLVIRANAPQGVLWQLEGLDVLNPNHIGQKDASGGEMCLLSMESLGKIDLLKGGFAPEYGNVISGVMDMHLKKGNMDDISGQATLNVYGGQGLVEVPIKPLGGSILINARTYGGYLLNKPFINNAIGLEIPRGMNDITTHIVIDTKPNHTLSLFGVWGSSFVTSVEKKDTAQRKGYGDFLHRAEKMNNLIVGGNYTIRFNEKKTLSLGLAYSTFNDSIYRNLIGLKIGKSLIKDTLNKDAVFNATNQFFYYKKIATHISYNVKYNRRIRAKYGITPTWIGFSCMDSVFNFATLQKELLHSTEGKQASAILWRAYAQGDFELNSRLQLVAGLHVSYFNSFFSKSQKSPAIEPRASLAYKITENETVYISNSFSSQLATMPNYFTKVATEKDKFPNRTLKPMKSNMLVVGIDIRLFKKYLIKLEAYQQYLFQVPVSDTGTYSILNEHGNPYNGKLVNTGTGQTYGGDLSVERFFSNKWFMLHSFSIFSTHYSVHEKAKQSGEVYNGRWDEWMIFNSTVGKIFGRQNNWDIAVHFVVKGGERYTPIDSVASEKAKIYIPNERFSYTKWVPPYHRLDFKIAHHVNKPKISYDTYLDIQNLLLLEYVFQQDITKLVTQPDIWYGWDGYKKEIYASKATFPILNLGVTFYFRNQK